MIAPLTRPSREPPPISPVSHGYVRQVGRGEGRMEDADD